ncbi:hypothetical protein WDU94_010624 [Cyamophila willieti]
MAPLATIFGVGVMLFASILVWAEHPHPTPFPSIDDQINKEMQPFYMLCEDGIIRGVLKDRITRILKEDYERDREANPAKYDANVTMVFNEGHHPKYLKKDNTLPQRVLDGVFKEALFLGTDKSKEDMKKDIKIEFNNGTLTDVEVDNVIHKMVWADPQNPFPSIDDQIKKSLVSFDTLFKSGIVRGFIQHKITRILYEKNTTTKNEGVYFREKYYHSKFLKEDKIIPQKLLDEVMKEALLIGTDKSKIEMKNEIKKEFNNGTLTDVEVDNVLRKILVILREKTKKQINKYVDEHINKELHELMLHFGNFFRLGDVRDILKRTIKQISNEHHEQHATNDTIDFNESSYVKYLKQDKKLRQRVLDAVMMDPLLIGTDESKIEIRNRIKKEINKGTLTDVEVDNLLRTLLVKLREKTKNELNKYIDEYETKDIDDTMTKRKQHKT